MGASHELIHGVADLRRVLSRAVPPVLVSAPGAAGYQGIGWWLALLRLARAEFPAVAFEAVLDCGNAPGLALAAIRSGVPAVRVKAPPQALSALD